MRPLRNEMILASAGSGKTYRLTNRFIALLARDVAPERIIALTFTRKAAAEFLDEILKKLGEAAADPAKAAQLGRDLELDDFNSFRALSLLRLVISRLHQLTLGTLDSFFHRILACFPAEFGLGTSFEVLNPHQEAEARARVFGQIFQNRKIHPAFTEAFKNATFGSEEKQLSSRLDDFVRYHHRTFLRQPKRSRWGDESTIWPKGCPWMGEPPSIDQIIADLRTATDGIEFASRGQTLWLDFLTKIRAIQPGKPRPKFTAFDRVLEHHEEIRSGHFDLKLDRGTYSFPPAACRALAQLIDLVLFCEVMPHLQRTRGIYEILSLFENDYHEQIRRAGKLGFEDIQMLLNGSLDAVDVRRLSLDGGDGRLHVDYRLDGQFDHWLLDEFQDTSNGQWRVISNLIDEVLQDSEGRRSLFYVGDVKQAIFGWRGGDSALFHDIFEHYNDLHPESIAKEHMEDSFRSGPALMSTINQIFGQTSRLRSLFPEHPELTDRWAACWVDHTTHHTTRQDYVEILTIPNDSETDLSAEERRLNAVTGLLERLAPPRRNLSCAILVRQNRTAGELANAIRAQTDVPVTVETDTLIGKDHPIASSFLALLQFAAHPGDSAAWKHLCMTPALRSQPQALLTTLRRTLGPDTLTNLHDHGFRGAFEDWLQRLLTGGFAPDAFALHRINQLRQATHDFDQQGNRSIGDFLRFAEATASRETPAAGVVQILTIHKSKGLGFDIVIVAELESKTSDSLTQTGNLSIVAHERGSGLNREIDWVLSMPSKDVCQLDERLHEARHRCEVDRGYEELCVLYVALTRAKFATHIVTIEPKEGKDPKGSARDVILTAFPTPEADAPTYELGGEIATVVHAAGDPNWADLRSTPTPKESGPPTVIPTLTTTRRFPSRRRAMPSSLAEEASSHRGHSRYLFSESSRNAAAFGTRVHAGFEGIDWLDSPEFSPLEPWIAASFDLEDPMSAEAAAEILGAMKVPEIDAVFRRATFGEAPVLWRERRFEIILNDAWVSGTFDRVVLTEDRAWIYDFKTNRIATAEEILQAKESYQPQLAVYRVALSRLTGIPPESIETHLIFTKPGVIA